MGLHGYQLHVQVPGNIFAKHITNDKRTEKCGCRNKRWFSWTFTGVCWLGQLKPVIKHSRKQRISCKRAREKTLGLGFLEKDKYMHVSYTYRTLYACTPSSEYATIENDDIHTKEAHLE